MPVSTEVTGSIPGALRSQSHLILQTRQSQRLVEGRKSDGGKSGILGLTGFAALLRSIWNGARAGDPYADWWLIRVQDALDESATELDALQAHVEHALQTLSGMTVTVAQSVQPISLPLTFGNPYAFRGAQLLARYDEVVRGILTARHVALFDRDTAERLLADAGRHVRRAYNAALGYRFLGINRDDVSLMTARGKQAETAMGTVPQEVMDGRLVPAHGPDRGSGDFKIRLSVKTAPAPVEPPAADSDGWEAAPSDGSDPAPAA
ncbi:MAG: TIGR03761 family integrating conjugative element protein [Pseudomonadota bacterium]|nr:TIGR03761 family integrating conjugative element protein [Pseudomonadota bacterium]